jgi:hypothetical protein
MIPSRIAISSSVNPEKAFVQASKSCLQRSNGTFTRKPSVMASEITVLRVTLLTRAIRAARVSESTGKVSVVRRVNRPPERRLVLVTYAV